MAEQNETVFVDGMIFKSKHQNAPDFVLGSIAIKVEDLTAFLAKHKKPDGWVNIDFLRGKPKEGETKGKPYFKLNTFVAEKKEDTASPADDELNDSSVPF